MIHGNKIFQILFFSLFFSMQCNCRGKIITTPLINVEKIKPSFEEIEEESENIISNQDLKKKKDY